MNHQHNGLSFWLDCLSNWAIPRPSLFSPSCKQRHRRNSKADGSSLPMAPCRSYLPTLHDYHDCWCAECGKIEALRYITVYPYQPEHRGTRVSFPFSLTDFPTASLRCLWKCSVLMQRPRRLQLWSWPHQINNCTSPRVCHDDHTHPQVKGSAFEEVSTDVPLCFFLVIHLSINYPVTCNSNTQMLHVWNIYQHLP